MVHGRAVIFSFFGHFYRILRVLALLCLSVSNNLSYHLYNEFTYWSSVLSLCFSLRFLWSAESFGLHSKSSVFLTFLASSKNTCLLPVNSLVFRRLPGIFLPKVKKLDHAHCYGNQTNLCFLLHPKPQHQCSVLHKVVLAL